MAKNEEYEVYEEEEEEMDENDMINREKHRLLDIMSKLDPTSQEYMVISQRLADITECSRNEAETIQAKKQADQIDRQRWAWIAPTICQTLGGIAGSYISQRESRKTVKSVIDYEHDGGILNTKSLSFMSKPRS